MGAAASVCDCRDCGSVRRRQALCGSGEAKRCVVLGGWAMCCVNCIVLAGSRPEGSMPSFPTFSVCCGHYRARGDGSCSAAAASCCKSEMVGALPTLVPCLGRVWLTLRSPAPSRRQRRAARGCPASNSHPAVASWSSPAPSSSTPAYIVKASQSSSRGSSIVRLPHRLAARIGWLRPALTCPMPINKRNQHLASHR
jgi:hypothetical protein